MEKLDLTKKYKSYYTAKTKPELVDIEAAQYLSIVGKGDPSSAAFTENIQALYTVAYTIKFMLKEQEQDFVVARLEGQWWYDETKYNNVSIDDTPTAIPRSEWHFRLLIRLPEYVTDLHIAKAINTAIEKKQMAFAGTIKLFKTDAGKAVQMLHIGPFDTEPETLRQLISFMQTNGYKKNGLHHEIYLSDFRKTPPEKLKTILREPTF